MNGLNQYLSAGPASFTYDANGNLTSDGSTTYVYDAENRLVSASGGRNATLRYDPLGRLYETIGGGATTRFVYDGDELVAEYTGTGTLLRRYLHGLRDDDPVVWYEGAGLTNPRWLHPDQQGSIVAVSNSAGAALGIDRYDDWGVPDASNMGRFQYTGQAWLPELGMFYYKARIYSPTLGRFLQTDPIGYRDQVNLYAYVGNDPYNQNDPSGQDAIVVVQQNGNVDVILPVIFSGDAATPDNINTVVTSVASASQEVGALNVTFHVMQGHSEIDPSVVNNISIVNGATSNPPHGDNPGGHSFVMGANGEISMADVNGTSLHTQNLNEVATSSKTDGTVIPHEIAGHLSGLDESNSNSFGGNLMFPGNGTSITISQLNSIQTTHPPSGQINTVVMCSQDNSQRGCR